jgi:hypothetical protein
MTRRRPRAPRGTTGASAGGDRRRVDCPVGLFDISPPCLGRRRPPALAAARLRVGASGRGLTSAAEKGTRLWSTTPRGSGALLALRRREQLRRPSGVDGGALFRSSRSEVLEMSSLHDAPACRGGHDRTRTGYRPAFAAGRAQRSVSRLCVRRSRGLSGVVPDDRTC